jgi:hypothetical protein
MPARGGEERTQSKQFMDSVLNRLNDVTSRKRSASASSRGRARECSRDQVEAGNEVRDVAKGNRRAATKRQTRRGLGGGNEGSRALSETCTRAGFEEPRGRRQEWQKDCREAGTPHAVKSTQRHLFKLERANHPLLIGPVNPSHRPVSRLCRCFEFGHSVMSQHTTLQMKCVFHRHQQMGKMCRQTGERSKADNRWQSQATIPAHSRSTEMRACLCEHKSVPETKICACLNHVHHRIQMSLPIP